MDKLNKPRVGLGCGRPLSGIAGCLADLTGTFTCRYLTAHLCCECFWHLLINLFQRHVVPPFNKTDIPTIVLDFVIHASGCNTMSGVFRHHFIGHRMILHHTTYVAYLAFAHFFPCSLWVFEVVITHECLHVIKLFLFEFMEIFFRDKFHRSKHLGSFLPQLSVLCLFSVFHVLSFEVFNHCIVPII